MDPNNQKSLSGPEICDILKACVDSKVRVLKYRGLYLQFGPTQAELKEQLGKTLTPAKEIAATQMKIAQTARIAEEIRNGEDEISDLLLTNPAAMEALIAQGKLNLDGSKPDDSDDLND